MRARGKKRGGVKEKTMLFVGLGEEKKNKKAILFSVDLLGS